MSESKSWECAECELPFPKSKLLAVHARQTKHKAYCCSADATCKKVFSLRTAAIRHVSSHSSRKAHTCSLCSKQFHRRDHCLEHEEICSTAASRHTLTQAPKSRIVRIPISALGIDENINAGVANSAAGPATFESQRNTITFAPGWESRDAPPWDSTPSQPQFSDLSNPAQQQNVNLYFNQARSTQDDERSQTRKAEILARKGLSAVVGFRASSIRDVGVGLRERML